MTRCLIADDEPIAREIVEQYILQTPGLTLIASCRNALEAFAKLEQFPIDLLFLDIEMPLVNGLTFVKTLAHPPKVIFTTAYPNYAVEAFDLDAADYLLKPFSYERFVKAVNKALPPAPEATPESSEPGHLLVKEKGGLIKIAHATIVYIQASGDYVKIVTPEKTHLANFTLKALEQQLPANQFIRIHKSYIVALDQVKMVRTEQVLLAGHQTLPLSPNFKEQLLALFRQ